MTGSKRNGSAHFWPPAEGPAASWRHSSGPVAVLFVIANLRHGTAWLPYALILGALVAAHLWLRAVHYKRRRHARHLAIGDMAG